MGSEIKRRKACFHCMKRRIICDLTLPKCKKCEKKGLDCPGYGIRYRFAGGKSTSTTTNDGPSTEVGDTITPQPLLSSQRRGRKLKWVDVSSEPRQTRKRGAVRCSQSASHAGEPSGHKGLINDAPEHQGYASPDASRHLEVLTGLQDEPTFLLHDGGKAHGSSRAALSHRTGNEISMPTAGCSPLRSSSAPGADDQVLEIARSNCRIHAAMPTFADPLFNLPPLLSNPDPKIRLLFDHFCTYVSPVMLLYDDETNGYRHQILPLALSNPVIERAVCVAAAFHLSLRKPELRLPAESGRAAIINKLTEKTLDLSETTWATILLLIVADLVTGHEHVLTLYKMLRSFLNARRQAAPQLDAQGGSELQNFLYFQSKLLSFFASPVLGEPNALDGFSHISQDPFACLVRPAPHTKQSVGHVDPTSETPGSSSLDTVDARTELYMHTIREAAEIYLARARTSEHCSAAYPAGLEHSTILHTTGTTSTQRTEADDIISQRVVHMRRLFEQVDSSAPGAHALVWPAFVAAAESRREDDREFFSAALRQIWESTGYGNVLKGLNALPEIWERQEHGQEWTGVLTNLKTLIM